MLKAAASRKVNQRAGAGTESSVIVLIGSLATDWDDDIGVAGITASPVRNDRLRVVALFPFSDYRDLTHAN